MEHTAPGSRNHHGHLRAAARGLLGITFLFASTAGAGIGVRSQGGLYPHALRIEVSFEPRLIEAIAALSFDAPEPTALAALVTTFVDAALNVCDRVRDANSQPKRSQAVFAASESSPRAAVMSDTTAFIAPSPSPLVPEATKNAPEPIEKAATPPASAGSAMPDASDNAPMPSVPSTIVVSTDASLPDGRSPIITASNTFAMDADARNRPNRFERVPAPTQALSTGAVMADAAGLTRQVQAPDLPVTTVIAPEPVDRVGAPFAPTDAVIAGAFDNPPVAFEFSAIDASTAPSSPDGGAANPSAITGATVQLASLSPASHSAPNLAPALTSRPLPEARGLEVFGSAAISAANAPIGLISRRAVLATSDPARAGDCDDTPGTLCDTKLSGEWQETLEHARGLKGAEQIAWLNQRVNQLVRYKSDSEAHGVAEQWSTAQETMARRSGDCEDYAVLKMALLRQLAFKSEDMFVVVVRGSAFTAQHAVLAVRRGDSTLILDNRTDALREDKEIREYQPLYSTNEHGLWVHGSRLPLKLTAGI